MTFPSRSALSAASPPHPAWTGAACMLLAVLCFALLDTVAKHLVVGGMNPLQAVWGRYAFSVIPMLLVAPLLGWGRLATTRPGLQLARGLTLIAATAAMFTGLRWLQLADAYALSYVSPIIVAVLSRYIFGERLARMQQIAIALSFAGVLVVIRPAFVQTGAAVVFPFLMAISYAAYQVLTRIARRSDDALVCVFYASLAGATVLSLVMPFIWQPMPASQWGAFTVMGGLGLIGHWLLAVAANRASPSLLAPLSYAQLVYAALIDLTIFGAIPDRWTVVGAAIILAGGALLWLGSKRLPDGPERVT